jgi:hypothetical protein
MILWTQPPQTTLAFMLLESNGKVNLSPSQKMAVWQVLLYSNGCDEIDLFLSDDTTAYNKA